MIKELCIVILHLIAIHKDYKTQNKNIEEDLISKETIVGRYAYASPEVQRGENYDYSCDIYSLGLTSLYLMSYENPILITTNAFRQKTRSVKTENIHKKYDSYLKKLILRMMNDNPNLRPTASDAYDELELIEIFMDRPNNKIIKKCLDDLNKNNNSMSDEHYNKINKKYQRLNSEMNNLNINNIREEYGFSSSNSIYSQYTPNPQFTPPNPQFTPNPQLTPNPQFTQNPQLTPNPQITPNPQSYQSFQSQNFTGTPQDFLNNNYPNNNTLNANNYYTENNNQYNINKTQNNFRGFRRMQTFQRPTFQMPLEIPPSSEVLSYANNVKEIEREREKEN